MSHIPRSNYTMIPNIILDKYLGELSGAEVKVLLYIARRTFGWNNDSDSISLSQIKDGYKGDEHEAGHGRRKQKDKGTGLSLPTITAAIRQLVALELISVEKRRSPVHGNETNVYRMLVEYDTGPGENQVQQRNPTKVALVATQETSVGSKSTAVPPTKAALQAPSKAALETKERYQKDIDGERNGTSQIRPASQPDTRASTREIRSKSGLAGLGLQPLGNDSTGGEETELQAMWRTVHAVTAILDDPAPSDEELGNYFVGVQENWYYNGTSRPADLLAVAREQRAGASWPPTSKSAQFRVYARNRTGRGDLNPRPKTKSAQNGHAPVSASNPAWNDRPADTWHDPEADRLHALTMARMGIDENGNEVPPVPDQKGPAA